MSIRLSLSDERYADLLIALSFAIQWEQWMIDSLVQCTDEEFVQAREQSRDNIRRFRKLSAWLRKKIA